MSFLRVACLFAITVATGLTVEEPKFIRTVEIAPVRLSYNDLSTLLTKVHQLVGAANTASEGVDVYERLTLDDTETGVELTHEFSEAALASAPAVIYSIEYEYSKRNAAVSMVRVRLWTILDRLQ